MPFGTKVSANTFQRFINCVLSDLTVTGVNGETRNVDTFAYIDDILIASTSPEEHLLDLTAIFTRLAEYDLRLNVTKSQFGLSDIIFLGHHITSTGLRPIVSKVEAISSFAKPVTCQELRRFIGIINFYRRFIPHAAHIFSPLNELLKGKGKNKKALIKWNSEADAAFEKAKACLKTTAELSFPDTSLPTALVCDASDVAAGAVLQQKTAQGWKPIGFFSRKFAPREQKYSAFSRELLAMFLSVKSFAYYLRGIDFSIFTDHKPLLSAFKKTQQRDNAREARHLSYISELTDDIQYIPGPENVVADALSRTNSENVYLNSIICRTAKTSNSCTTVTNDSTLDHSITAPMHVVDDNNLNHSVNITRVTQSQYNYCDISAILESSDTEELINSQKSDSQLAEFLKNSSKTNLKLESIDGIICDTSTNKPRPYLPGSFIKKIFHQVHDISHPGIRTTKKLISSKFVFPKLNSTIQELCRTCQPCQKSKVIRHVHSPISSIPPHSEKFSQVHIDLVGPLPPVDGYRYLLTMIDRFTRWPEVVPLQDIRAITVARAFVQHWIARYGVPKSISTDRGAQFESMLFNELATMLGSVHIRTTSFHPSSNGLIERTHRTLKTALRAQAEPLQWLYKLPLILLYLRTSIKEDLQCSSSDMLYGCNLKIPADLIFPRLHPNNM
jgi:cleavage and polyadenylation specificity factor subunit 1